jgi:cubilin
MCGGHIGGANGTLTSPNYPSPYDNDTDCEWFVDGPTGHYLQFSFADLRLESLDGDSNCTSSDFVEIRDFNSTGKASGLGILLGEIETR